MLTQDMRDLILAFSAGSVATINDDGTPSVSPKATFVVLDDVTIAFGNIRSPGTVRNLQHRESIEVCFTDILARRAVRVSGTGKSIPKSEADASLLDAFRTSWAPYVEFVHSFVVINVTSAEFITSPAYDVGFTEAELRETNLKKLMDL